MNACRFLLWSSDFLRCSSPLLFSVFLIVDTWALACSKWFSRSFTVTLESFLTSLTIACCVLAVISLLGRGASSRREIVLQIHEKLGLEKMFWSLLLQHAPLLFSSSVLIRSWVYRKSSLLWRAESVKKQSLCAPLYQAGHLDNNTSDLKFIWGSYKFKCSIVNV